MRLQNVTYQKTKLACDCAPCAKVSVLMQAAVGVCEKRGYAELIQNRCYQHPNREKYRHFRWDVQQDVGKANFFKESLNRTFHRPDYLHARHYGCFSVSVQPSTCGATAAFWVLASLNMRHHLFPVSTLLLHPRFRWICAVFLRTTSTHLVLGFPTAYPYPHRRKLVSVAAMHKITDIS